MRGIATLVAVACLGSGCAALRKDPTTCKLAVVAGSALVGAGIGAGVATATDPSSDTEAEFVTGFGFGGAIVGGLLGLLPANLLCAEPPPPPPPPPAAAPPPPPATTLATITGPQFAFDRADLSPDGRAAVRKAAQTLQQHPAVRVHVDGHTDGVGSASYNAALSRRRAETVRDLMVAEGIAPDRIEVRALGKSAPVADNATPEGRAQNRRVEIVVR